MAGKDKKPEIYDDGKLVHTADNMSDREKWELLDGKGRAQYIWDYYKYPIIIAAAVIFGLVSFIRMQLTRKEEVLIVAPINVNLDETLEEPLTTDFLTWEGLKTSKNYVQLYSMFYLTDSEEASGNQYAMGSQIQLFTYAGAGKLDIVFMNEKGFELLANDGYLYPMDEFLDEYGAEIKDSALPLLRENANGSALDVSGIEMFSDQGFEGTVYLGVILTTGHQEISADYIKYLLS
jgi:hypothetical protein